MKLAILGLGIMGERLLRAALAHPATTLAAVWDPAPEAAARLAAIDARLAMAPSADAAIAAAEAVYVASPPASHIAHGRAILMAGRALFLEKPLASDVAAARDFVAWAKGHRAAVNFPMASSPATAQALRWLPEIGPLRSIEITCAFANWPRGWQQAAASWLAKRAEGGFTREVVSHFFFLAQRVGGPLRLLDGSADYPSGDGSEVAARARLMAGEMPVTFVGAVGGTDLDETNETRLVGAQGQIRLRDWSYAERLGADGAWHAAPDALPNPAMRPVTLAGQLDKLAALTRGETTSLATLEEALAVQEAVEAILTA
jgi:predicted dehydrogenase